MITHLDLFSGIGGFALAAHSVGGIQTKQFVELDSYCQQVLTRNFPGVPIHTDITNFYPDNYYDLITAGFPCQPHSLAGKRKGSADERDLWGETYRVISTVKPRYVVLENVSGLITSEDGSFFRRLLRQLTEAGYSVAWDVVSCQALGGVHKRERLWIAAYTESSRRGSPWSQEDKTRANTPPISSGYDAGSQPRGIQTKSELCSLHDGLPRNLDLCLMTPETLPHALPYCSDGLYNPTRRQQLKALGNAIVPKVAAIAIRKALELPATVSSYYNSPG